MRLERALCLCLTPSAGRSLSGLSPGCFVGLLPMLLWLELAVCLLLLLVSMMFDSTILSIGSRSDFGFGFGLLLAVVFSHRLFDCSIVCCCCYCYLMLVALSYLGFR